MKLCNGPPGYRQHGYDHVTVCLCWCITCSVSKGGQLQHVYMLCVLRSMRALIQLLSKLRAQGWTKPYIKSRIRAAFAFAPPPHPLLPLWGWLVLASPTLHLQLKPSSGASLLLSGEIREYSSSSDMFRYPLLTCCCFVWCLFFTDQRKVSPALSWRSR